MERPLPAETAAAVPAVAVAVAPVAPVAAPVPGNGDKPVRGDEFVLRGCNPKKVQGNYRVMATDFLPQFKDHGKSSACTNTQYTAEEFYEHLHSDSVRHKVGGVFHVTGQEATESTAPAFVDQPKHVYFDFTKHVDLSQTGPPYELNWGTNKSCDGPASMLAAKATHRGIQAPKSKLEALKPSKKKLSAPTSAP